MNFKPSLRAIAKQSRVWIAASAFSLLAMTSMAWAEDTAKAPVPYAPEFCDFAIEFPEAPYTVQRCDEDNATRCYDLVSYTQVFDMTTTVNFRVICNKIGPDIHKSYSPEVMEATLRAMTKKSVVQEFNTSFSQEEGYKMAGLVGEGQSGRMPTIYIAQLWIGDRSAFSVEAELIGDINDPADEAFSSVLRSIHFKKDEPEADDSAEETSPEAEPAP